ncbi:Serine/threonine-protein kinase smg1 [Entophlyctis luteolus]|nr:Serine/threonine-protein kinase smg1 [Entophlyctis luteolus]KAJ3394436.1 Serine/threonine-protein kinase smg1 [Entophlyctis sp. JEL0112]
MTAPVAIPDRQLLDTIQKDSPALIKALTSIISSVKATAAKLADLKHRLPSMPTSSGVSLLEVKVHTLLSYLTHLSFFVLLKLNGISTATNPVHGCVDSMIEERVVLEKIKPIEARLRYQIDKVLKAASAASGRNSSDGHGDEIMRVDLAARDAVGAIAGLDGTADPLQFRPNPRNFGKDSNGEGTVQVPETGVYRPPKIAPLRYSGDKMSSKRSTAASASNAAAASLSKSRLFRDMRETFDTTRPEQVTSHGTGYGVRELRDAQDEELAKIEEFELSNYQRIGATRDRNKRERAAMRRAGAAAVLDEMANLEADFTRLDGLHRSIALDDSERLGPAGSVLAKRNVRAEEVFDGSRKKGKFKDAAELVSKVSNTEGLHGAAYSRDVKRARQQKNRAKGKQ